MMPRSKQLNTTERYRLAEKNVTYANLIYGAGLNANGTHTVVEYHVIDVISGRTKRSYNNHAQALVMVTKLNAL